MNQIPHHRKVFYLLLLGLLPLVLVYYDYSAKSERHEELSRELYKTTTQTASELQKNAYHKLVKRSYIDKEHFFLAKQIETIRPLSQEIEKIKKMTAAGFHPEREPLE